MIGSLSCKASCAMLDHQRIAHRADASFGCRCQGLRDLGETPHVACADLQAQHPGGGLGHVGLQHRAGMQAIPEHRHLCEPWQHLPQQRHRLATQFGEQ
jgi:hypothetical protein